MAKKRIAKTATFKKVPRKKSRTGKAVVDRYVLIEKALHKMTKKELIESLVMLAKGGEVARRKLEKQLKIEKPLELLCADIESAIDCATEIDKSRINHNFDYDYQSYADIEAGFKALIKRGEFTVVKNLSITLMKAGSLQVEYSDEGLMSDDIEDCLNPVINAINKADSDGARAWSRQMIAADRVGFICSSKLKKMAGE